MSESGSATTIVIPVWDDYVSERLEQAFQSVRRQRTPPPPIVVVDNASTVPLPLLLEASVVRAPIRLILGESRNLGLTRVDTRYVIFWDADDVMLDGTLPFLEEAISADPRLVAFATAVVEDPSGRRHRLPRRWIKRLVRSPQRFALLNAIWSLYPSTGSTIMRTDAVRAAGGYDNANSGEDRYPRLGAKVATAGVGRSAHRHRHPSGAGKLAALTCPGDSVSGVSARGIDELFASTGRRPPRLVHVSRQPPRASPGSSSCAPGPPASRTRSRRSS